MVTYRKSCCRWSDPWQADALMFPDLKQQAFLSRDRSRQRMLDEPKTGCACSKTPFLRVDDPRISGFRRNSEGRPRFDFENEVRLRHRMLAQRGKHRTQRLNRILLGTVHPAAC
jgi:hypothetical protein